MFTAFVSFEIYVNKLRNNLTVGWLISRVLWTVPLHPPHPPPPIGILHDTKHEIDVSVQDELATLDSSEHNIRSSGPNEPPIERTQLTFLATRLSLLKKQRFDCFVSE